MKTICRQQEVSLVIDCQPLGQTHVVLGILSKSLDTGVLDGPAPYPHDQLDGDGGSHDEETNERNLGGRELLGEDALKRFDGDLEGRPVSATKVLIHRGRRKFTWRKEAIMKTLKTTTPIGSIRFLPVG